MTPKTLQHAGLALVAALASLTSGIAWELAHDGAVITSDFARCAVIALIVGAAWYRLVAARLLA